MPSPTYTLIASNTLSSSAASVTFSSIPNTFTDLVLKGSSRSAGGNQAFAILLRFNSDSATNYSDTTIEGSGSAASSYRESNSVYGYITNGNVGSSATANTFSNWELYLPNYTVNSNKPFADFSVTETNATAAKMSADAGLWRNTATISSIVLTDNGGNFVSGSSFFLYGIKNS